MIRTLVQDLTLAMFKFLGDSTWRLYKISMNLRSRLPLKLSYMKNKLKFFQRCYTFIILMLEAVWNYALIVIFFYLHDCNLATWY